MQKKFAAMTLALLMILSVTASALAIQPRWSATASCDPTLAFSGTTAYCTAQVRADADADISGTMTLYRVSGSSKYYVDSWSISGTGKYYDTETCSVTKGQTYKLVLDVTVSGANGTDDISVSAQKTCK